MQLSMRLQAVADMVSRNHRVADVGCDHAFLPVWLIQENRIPSAIAMDVKKGPLSRAEEHIRAASLEDKIETRLSDGLKNLQPSEADTLVIAGMGGILLQKILSDSPEVRDSFKELILQPQSDIPAVRRYMQKAGFGLMDEDMVLEDGKFYVIMKWVPRELFRQKQPQDLFAWTPVEFQFGPVLLKKRHPVLLQFLARERRIHLEILEALNDGGSGRSEKRKEEILNSLALIDHAAEMIQ